MNLSLVIIFVLTSAIFSATYFSSLVFAADNEYTMSCSYTKDKKTAFCSDNDPTNNDLWRCDKQKNGTWKCGKVVEQQSGPNLPGDLKKALNLATENAVTVSPSNDTTAPRDFMSKRDQLSDQKVQIEPDQENSNSTQLQ